MLTPQNLPKLNQVHISQVQAGVMLVNLGTLLELDEHPQHYCLIICRMGEKQVLKFDKDIFLVVE